MPDRSRRDFLKAAAITAATATLAPGQAEKAAAPFPYVDGLVLDLLEKPADIRAAGLSAMLYDISGYEEIASEAGGPRWQRTLNGTTAKMVRARQVFRQMRDVFVGTHGGEIRTAFKTRRTAVFFQVQGGGEIVGDDLSRIDLMHELGLSVLQITHHFDNKLGGGGLQPKVSGLTKLGFEAVERLNIFGIIPDLSHSSDLTGFDVLKRCTRSFTSST